MTLLPTIGIVTTAVELTVAGALLIVSGFAFANGRRNSGISFIVLALIWIGAAVWTASAIRGL